MKEKRRKWSGLLLVLMAVAVISNLFTDAEVWALYAIDTLYSVERTEFYDNGEIVGITSTSDCFHNSIVGNYSAIWAFDQPPHESRTIYSYQVFNIMRKDPSDPTEFVVEIQYEKFKGEKGELRVVELPDNIGRKMQYDGFYAQHVDEIIATIEDQANLGYVSASVTIDDNPDTYENVGIKDVRFRLSNLIEEESVFAIMVPRDAKLSFKIMSMQLYDKNAPILATRLPPPETEYECTAYPIGVLIRTVPLGTQLYLKAPDTISAAKHIVMEDPKIAAQFTIDRIVNIFSKMVITDSAGNIVLTASTPIPCEAAHFEQKIEGDYTASLWIDTTFEKVNSSGRTIGETRVNKVFSEWSWTQTEVPIVNYAKKANIPPFVFAGPTFQWLDDWDVRFIEDSPECNGGDTTMKAFGASANNGQITNVVDYRALLRSYAKVQSVRGESSRAKDKKVIAKRSFRLPNVSNVWKVDLKGQLEGVLTSSGEALHPFARIWYDAQIRNSEGVITHNFNGYKEAKDVARFITGEFTLDSQILPHGDYEVTASLMTQAGVDGRVLFISQEATADFYNKAGEGIYKDVKHGTKGWWVRISATPATTIPITATAKGSQTPEVDDPPFTTDPIVENEDFTITPDGFDSCHTLPLGDGVNEGTSWSFDFKTDPEFQCFPTSLPLASALLTLELTPKSSPFTDAFTLDGLSPIITPTIQELPIGVPSAIQIELANFYHNMSLTRLFKAKNGSIPAFYADDAIVSFAELTLTSFPGEKVNDRFPDLGPENVDTDLEVTPCAENCVGTFTITAEFKNTSSDTLSDLFFDVNQLTGENVLCNADGGVPWGCGADLTVPMDGVLKPQESFTVVFEIGLKSMKPFIFKVDLFGKVQK